MKKLTLSCLALCLAFTAWAEPVGKQAALYTAKAYMLAKGKVLDGQVTTDNRLRAKASPSENEQPYYYVFNAGGDGGGGYVIVSADDRVEPILGYVEEGSFDPDNIPENMRAWLQGYADEIKYIIDNDLQPGSPMLRKRNKVQGAKHSVPELLTTRWNQGHPYNLTCPKYYKEDGTQHYPAAGCVATAMAQVVNFYKFPLRTKAAIPAHSNTYKLSDGTEKTVSMKAIPRSTPIDWDNMRDTYNCNDEHEHDIQDTAVANLMLYCGQGVKMGYGGSSGAVSSRSRDFFVNYFGYSETAFWGGRGNYTIDEWFNMLYREVELGHPVLYAGHSSGGGHAFVLDGFDGDGLFHVNWGWGGGSNGWFLVSILNPGDNSGIGASSSSDGYSMSQGALFSLRTPGTPKEEPYLFISDVTANKAIVKATYTNKTGTSGNFHAGLVMLEENGTLSLVGSRLAISGLAGGSKVTKTFSVKGKLPEGTYKLSPAYKPAKSEEWLPAFDMQNQYIEAEVDSAGNVSMNLLKPIPTEEEISIDTIVFPGTRIAGQSQEVKVTFRNDGKEYFKTVYLFAGKGNTKVYTESKSMVAVRTGETTEVSYFFKPEETGTYNLWFCTDDKGNNVMGQGTMEVITEAEAVKAVLSVTSFVMSNGSGETVYGKRLVGKASIRNSTKNDYHGGIRLQIWSQQIGSGTAWSGSSKTFNVDIAAGKIATVDFSFDNLSEGYYYHIKAMYTNQDGTLGSGGIWDHRWEVKAGILTWKNDGTIGGQAYRASLVTSALNCGIYADCNKMNRVTPNKNPNTIYAFARDMEVPASLDTCNTVSGNHAAHIRLKNDKPYYLPVSFRADTASFTYTFPETETGTGWHAFTMPFSTDSIFLDDTFVPLNDENKHFWIYEFSGQDGNGKAAFTPATELRSNTPYIIAADATMAGRSIVFRSLDVPFYKTGSDKMLVTTKDYKFHGNTYAPKLNDCYILNADGTAFEYVTKATQLTGLNPYFTTPLPEEERPEAIVLPDIPVAPVREMTLDEASSEPVLAGFYSQLTLKRAFDAGLNTVCLPFAVDDVAAMFGQNAQAYEFCGLADNELDFTPVSSLAAGKPYILSLQEAIAEDIVLNDVTIEAAATEAGSVLRTGGSFCGTFSPLAASSLAKEVYGIAADGSIVRIDADASILGFRAFLDLPTGAEGVRLRLYDDPTGIKGRTLMADGQTPIFNPAGQRLGKPAKGINIIGGRKVLK